MANLSNINNKFLFTDGDFLKIGNLAPINNVSSTESGISVINSNVASLALTSTAATGKTYAIMSEGPGGFRIRDVDANNDRLIINTSGNATFAGRVTIGTVDTVTGGHLNIGEASPTIQLFDTTNDAKLLIYTQDSSSIIGTYSNHPLAFYTDSGLTLTLNTDHSATFAGETYFNKGVRFYRYTDQANFWSVYTNTDDSLRFNYNGAGNDEITIDSSGRVGIGVTPFVSSLPNTVIDINPVASIWGYANSVYLNSNAYYNNGWLYKSTAAAGVLQVDGDVLRFRAAASGTANAGVAFDVPFIVDSGGNVGIGTTSPDAKLDVEDTVTYQIMAKYNATNYTEYGYFGLNVVGGGNPYLFKLQGTERIRITSAGNIQFAQDAYINTNTADASDNLSLQLSGGGAFGDTRGACIALAGNENGNGGLMQLRAGDGSVGGIRYYTGGSERMRLAGRLISFNSTTGVQEIRGDAASAKFAIGNMGDASSQMMVSSRGFLTLNTSNTGSALDATERMRIKSSGEVGISNTNPLFELCIGATPSPNRNGLEFAIASSDAGTNILQSYNRATAAYTPYRIAAYTVSVLSGSNAQYSTTFDTTGNVGIGITNPQDKLHVNGDAIISSTKFGDFATASINTTGFVVATVGATTNGQSAIVEFVASGNNGGYYNVVYSCYNGGGLWYYTKNVVGSGGNIEVAEINGAGSSTLSFSFRSTSGTAAYTPRVMMKGMPYNLVTF